MLNRYHNDELEIAIANNESSFLGLVISQPAMFSETSEIIKPEMFHIEGNKILYQALCECHLNMETFDIALFINYLTDNKLLHKISSYGRQGTDYINWLMENGGYPTEINKYTQNIINQYKTDCLYHLLNDTHNVMNTQPYDINELIGVLQRELINIDISEINSPFSTIKEETNKIVDKITSLDEQVSTGLTLGYASLDNMLIGLNPGDLVILAARPSMGKTAFALNLAKNVAEQGKTVFFFSLEMTNPQLVERMISIESTVPISNLRKKDINTRHLQLLYSSKEKMSNWHMWLNDKSSLTISDLQTLSKRLAATKQPDLLIVDYLQLIGTSTKTNNENRQLEISKISRTLKQLARELKCPIIALSQLSRNVEKREDKRPILSDLRESGSIEQDADVVLFLHRNDYYNRNKKKDGNGSDNADANPYSVDPELQENSITDVIVAKNRHGAIGVAQLLFAPHINRFFYENKKQ